jgi:competence protein ComEC
MNPWRPFPLIRLAAAFAAGILAAILRLSEMQIPPGFLAALLLPVLVLAAFPGLISGYRWRWVRGAFIYLAFAVTGYQYALDSRPAYFTMDSIRSPKGEGILLAKIREQPVRKAKSVRLAADIWLRDTVSGACSYLGTGLIYLQTEPRAQRLSTGDLILLAGEPDLLPPPSVPGGFDMRGWFGRKGIFYRLYAPSAKWKFLARDPSISIRRTAEEVRDKLLGILQKNHVTGEEFSVAAALLLGYVSEIDRELLSDYSSSGAMHILSVSGMHVGVVYLFLEFLLGFLERRRRSGGIASWLKATVMVLSIWSYAVLTGLSPPVQRAAIMLSMVIIGKNMKRQPGILNILAASLFIILVSDPFLLADTGCQFSYLAVAGIVLLYKPVYDLYVTSNWFPDKLWSLVAVSIRSLP